QLRIVRAPAGPPARWREGAPATPTPALRRRKARASTSARRRWTRVCATRLPPPPRRFHRKTTRFPECASAPSAWHNAGAPMDLADFDYDLPEERIAQQPLADR